MNKLKEIVKLLTAFLIYFIFLFISKFIITYFNLKNNSKHTLLVMIISSFISTLLLIFIYKKDFKEDFKKLKKDHKKILVQSFHYYFIALVIFFIYQLIISRIYINNLPSNENQVRALFEISYPLALIYTVLLAPISEEILFRFSFYKIINNKVIFLISTSLIFAILHISNFHLLEQLVFIISYLILSTGLGYILVKSDNIYSSIIIHMSHNLLSVILLFFQIGV